MIIFLSRTSSTHVNETTGDHKSGMQYNRPTINYILFVRYLLLENRIKQLIKIIDFKKLIIYGKSELMCSIIINLKKTNSAKFKIPHNRIVKNCWCSCHILQFIIFSINNGLLRTYCKQNTSMLRQNQSAWNCTIPTTKGFMLTVLMKTILGLYKHRGTDHSGREV
jgi:hypothetical protein